MTRMRGCRRCPDLSLSRKNIWFFLLPSAKGNLWAASSRCAASSPAGDYSQEMSMAQGPWARVSMDTSSTSWARVASADAAT